MQVLRLFDPFGAVHIGVVHFPRVSRANLRTVGRDTRRPQRGRTRNAAQTRIPRRHMLTRPAPPHIHRSSGRCKSCGCSTPLGPYIQVWYTFRGFALLTRGYRIVRPRRGRWPHGFPAKTSGGSEMKIKNTVFLFISLALHTLAPPKTGGGSEMKIKNAVFLFISLALHTLAPPKTGGGSEMKIKTLFFFSFRSPCTIFAPRQRFARHGHAPACAMKKGNRCKSCAVPLLYVPFFRRHSTYSCHWLGTA